MFDFNNHLTTSKLLLESTSVEEGGIKLFLLQKQCFPKVHLGIDIIV